MINIQEREEDGRYEAYAIHKGLKYSKVVYRDPHTGWPFEYRQLAHDAIKAVIIAKEK